MADPAAGPSQGADGESARTLLTVSGLTVATTEGRELVRDVSFTVARGSRLAVIGETGSGKSLTALAMVGLLPAGLSATGSIVYDDIRGGTQLLEAPERTRNRIRGRTVSVIFQEPLTALDPLMRIGKQLAEPIRRVRKLRGHAVRRAVCRALEEVRLSEPERIARSFPHEVSGGQRQRAAIALALACEPELLIADEATTALDVTVQSDILALLDDVVRSRGLSLLFISHDLAAVAQIASTVLVLRAGEVVERGELDTVIGEPSDDYTRSLVASARRLERAVRAGTGGMTAPGVMGRES